MNEFQVGDRVRIVRYDDAGLVGTVGTVVPEKSFFTYVKLDLPNPLALQHHFVPCVPAELELLNE